ncbi:GNAT family N-acetyltransferase [Clostridium beijerinckii]|nr:GNAT family N-acetyltransferase [Clostridium beijerinckii]
MNKWNIREFNKLTLKQLYEITRSRCEVFIQEQKIICEEELDGLDDKCIHVFLEENERVVAYCRIVPKGINHENISIGRVLVLNEFRKKGIAQEMLKETVEYIKSNFQENKIVLSSQLYAKSLYENVGFIVTSDIYEEAGIPHIEMHKLLIK